MDSHFLTAFQHKKNIHDPASNKIVNFVAFGIAWVLVHFLSVLLTHIHSLQNFVKVKWKKNKMVAKMVDVLNWRRHIFLPDVEYVHGFQGGLIPSWLHGACRFSDFSRVYIYTYILSASVAYQFIFLCISKWHEWNSGNLWASLTEIIVNKTLNQAFLWIARMFTTTIKWSSQIMVSSHSYSKASKGKKIIFRMHNMSTLVCFNMQHHDIILMCWTCDLLLIWFLIL